ncbi:MAG: tRNA (adenosine(37)-N6)-threonylcarbamoyltransferase complex ATPase subunit type 1 TsaE [Acidimicrobiia bacterium]
MPPELVVLTQSATRTAAVAAALARLSRPGDLVLLTGDLGAGKTTFCQGFGAALGVREPITSPTFTLHHRYEGRLVMHHLDVYRIDQIEETIELGLAELLDSGGVTLIEWGDAIRPALPADYLEITLELGERDEDRQVRVQCTGSGWADRFAALCRELPAAAAGGA